MKNKDIAHEIDQILQSGSQKQRVHTSHFFTTRVMGKVEQLEDSTMWYARFSMVLRPVLIALVVVNIANFYFYNNEPEAKDEFSVSLQLAVNDYSAWNEDFILLDNMVLDNNK